jgi:hypothetical protein
MIDIPDYNEVVKDWEPDAWIRDEPEDPGKPYFALRWEPATDEVLMLGPEGTETWVLLGPTTEPPHFLTQTTVSWGGKTYWAHF